MGRIGCCPTTGRADASTCGDKGCAAAATGRDPVMIEAGTDVAAPRLMKLLTFVTLVMFVT